MVKRSRTQKNQSQVHSPHGREPGLEPQRTLTLRNRQRLRPVDLRLLRRIVQALLHATRPEAGFDLALYLVSTPEITRLNESFLQHKGSTDVITFDYSETAGQASPLSQSEASAQPGGDCQDACPTLLHGEVFVCLEEAVTQARRFRTTWHSELVRYVVHGVLHLLGYDDRDARTRPRMKEAEDTLVRHLACQFDFHRLVRTASRPRLAARANRL